MILDVLFPNRCIHCNTIIDPELLVCGLCFSQIHFTHYNYFENNPVKEKCSLFFPVENAFSLIQFEEESLSRQIIHELKYRSREKAGKILADWTAERLDFKDNFPDLLVNTPPSSKENEETRIRPAAFVYLNFIFILHY